MLGAIYRNEQFAYIRDRIARNIIYSPQAVKAGWTGKVRVVFVIKEDGTVEDVRISNSSEIPLLDRNALESVWRAAPFPKPPAKARIKIPVIFILE